MWQMWLIIAGVCLVIEIFTSGFLVFWFSIGALIAMCSSFFTDNLIIQTSIFIISSTILLFATKPFAKKFMKVENTIKTNVYSIIGKTGIVTQDINSIESAGQVKIAGETWSAIPNEDIPIAKGTKIKVLEVNGVKLIVEPLKVASNDK